MVNFHRSHSRSLSNNPYLVLVGSGCFRKWKTKQMFSNFVDIQVDAKNRQSFTGSKIPTDSPSFVELPGSAVKDRSDNGNR